jgi:hypothetical protein
VVALGARGWFGEYTYDEMEDADWFVSISV